MSRMVLIHGSCADPVAESAKQCCRAYQKFLADYPDHSVDVTLCAFSPSEYQIAKAVCDSLLA